MLKGTYFVDTSEEGLDKIFSFLLPWLPKVRKESGKTKILQGQGQVREFHSDSEKIYIFERNQRKSKISSKYEVVHLALALFLIKVGDTSLFVILMLLKHIVKSS